MFIKDEPANAQGAPLTTPRAHTSEPSDPHDTRGEPELNRRPPVSTHDEYDNPLYARQ